ncbi:MAG: hypothetical protein K6G90_13725 [Clostridia bacterium]|nr:hypothetical protein [Clostridia bacterium]
MSKTVKEKAIEWGCSESTVKRYCASGIIPTAEQVGIRKSWSLPDNCKKPPMTRHGLCFLLDTIYQVNQGAAVDISSWGYPEKQIKEGYSYLISFAFMTSFSWMEIKKKLKDCTVTKRGEQLIARENKESKGKTSFKAHVTAKANIGVANIEIGAEVSHEEVG